MTLLTALEELAYRRVLDLIVVTNDQLRDDPRVLPVATKAGRAWPAVKRRLLELGKIQIEGNYIRNRRATASCTESRTLVAQKVAAGQASAAARKSLNSLDCTATDAATSATTYVVADVATNQKSLIKEQGSSASRSSPDGAADGARSRIPRTKPQVPAEVLEAMCAKWNEMAAGVGLPQVSQLTTKRKVALAKLLVDELGGDIDRWQRYLGAIAASPFLTGHGARGWRADLDWASRVASLIGVREGRYESNSETHR